MLRRMLMASNAAASGPKFDSAVKDYYVTLSSDKLTASVSPGPGGFVSVFGDTARSSGKRLLEYVAVAASNCIFGVADKTSVGSFLNPSGSPPGNPAGTVANSMGLRQSGQQLFKFAASSHNTGGTGFATGNTVGVAIDFEEATFGFYVNGDPVFSGSMPSGLVLFPIASITQSNSVSINNGALNYPISGYTAW